MHLHGYQLLASTAAIGVAVGQGISPSSNAVSGFAAPAAEYRPKFRYWLPDADVDHDVLKTDIQDLQKLGAGGLEFLPFYNYGFGGVNDSKMETYAFGKPVLDSWKRELSSAGPTIPKPTYSSVAAASPPTDRGRLTHRQQQQHGRRQTDPPHRQGQPRTIAPPRQDLCVFICLEARAPTRAYNSYTI